MAERMSGPFESLSQEVERMRLVLSNPLTAMTVMSAW